jgi:hypothetical protein
VQLGDQLEGFRGEDGFVARLERGVDLHAGGRVRLMVAPGEG